MDARQRSAKHGGLVSGPGARRSIQRDLCRTRPRLLQNCGYEGFLPYGEMECPDLRSLRIAFLDGLMPLFYTDWYRNRFDSGQGFSTDRYGN